MSVWPSTITGVARKIAPVALVVSTIFSSFLYAQGTSELIEDSDYARGIKAFAQGDFKQAADLWLADAYLGSADAQFNIGVLYVEGKGLPNDRGEAVFWFEKAARQDHREAQYNLGHLLLEETDDPDKVRQGIEWWRQSAEGGFPIAQFNYGRALYYGIGTDENREGAKSWFERAANGGNDKAKAFLEENHGRFIDAPPPVEITEPEVVRAEAPTVETVVRSNTQGVETTPGGVVKKSDYVLVKDKPVLVYSRFNSFSPIVTRVDARILLRVINRNKGWLEVEVPGGFPGWVRNDQIRISKGLVEITKGVAVVRADPTESGESNDIGELMNGSRVLLLEQQDGWTRVQLPEQIAGWVEQEGVRQLKAKPEEIAQVWQNQRIKQKVEALGAREIEVADIQPVLKATVREEPAVQEPPAPAIEYTDLADPQQTILVASWEVKRARSTASVPVSGRKADDIADVRGVEHVSPERQTGDAPEPASSTPEPAVAPQTYDSGLAGTGISNDNQWLFEQTAKKYTLQLFSIQNRASAEGQMRSLNRRGQFYSTVIKGDRWYFVLLGKFLTKQAAMSEVNRLPAWASDAQVRSLVRLQANRCKKLGLYNDDEVRGLAELCR